MRFDLLEQVMTGALATPRITLKMVADGLREVIPDAIEAERKVGILYGLAFQKREKIYDAMTGRVPLPPIQ
jgi:hypothetical protein